MGAPAKMSAPVLRGGTTPDTARVSWGGDGGGEMAGVGKLILGPHEALAVSESRVCFITSLVRDWSRAQVTPNSFLAPAELPVGKWIQDARHLVGN